MQPFAGQISTHTVAGDAGKCLAASANAGFPSDKYPCAVRVSAIPSDGGSVEAAVRQCRQVVEPLLQDRVTEKELQRTRLQAQVRCLRGGHAVYQGLIAE